MDERCRVWVRRDDQNGRSSGDAECRFDRVKTRVVHAARVRQDMDSTRQGVY